MITASAPATASAGVGVTPRHPWPAARPSRAAVPGATSNPAPSRLRPIAAPMIPVPSRASDRIGALIESVVPPIAEHKRGRWLPCPYRRAPAHLLPGHDIDRSVAFYEKLGFEELRRVPIRDEATNVFMGLPGDGPRLELTHNHGVDEPYDVGTGYGHIAISADDLDATLERLASQGIEPEKPPYRCARAARGSASCATPTATELKSLKREGPQDDDHRRAQDGSRGVLGDIQRSRRVGLRRTGCSRLRESQCGTRHVGGPGGPAPGGGAAVRSLPRYALRRRGGLHRRRPGRGSRLDERDTGGNVRPFPPSGKTFRARQIHTLRFDDQQRVIEHLAVRDDVSMLQQLGHMPAPGG